MLFCFSALLVVSLVLLMQWSIGKGMVEYVNAKEEDALEPFTKELGQLYQREDSWQPLKNQHRKFHRMLNAYLRNSEFSWPLLPKRHGGVKPLPVNDKLQNRPPPHERRGRPYLPPKMEEQYAVLDHQRQKIVGRYNQDLEYSYTDIKVEQITVGYLAILKRHRLTQGYELDFLQQQQHYFLLIALGVMLAVVLVTIPIASHIVRPINRIAGGMAKLTQGDYRQALTVDRQDELGALSKDFNQLSITLLENEQARKRWLANTSHELRTPLSILRGELEAILDGIRPMNKPSIISLSDEVAHLEHLINDLQQLTSADIGGLSYTMKPINLNRWLVNELVKYKDYLSDANIAFELNAFDDNIDIIADKDRLSQLLNNIFANAIKYAQASRVTLSLSKENKQPGWIRVTIADDGLGVDEKHLSHLFEYLYRVDDSRNRSTGGSGLGLSICAHIVNAHHGNIYAETSELGGLAIVIELPVQSVK